MDSKGKVDYKIAPGIRIIIDLNVLSINTSPFSCRLSNPSKSWREEALHPIPYMVVTSLENEVITTKGLPNLATFAVLPPSGTPGGQSLSSLGNTLANR